MQRLDLSLNDPFENLALDEALLDAVESQESQETLRLWQFQQVVVVLGRASRHADEIDVAACQMDGVPMMRRSSGGTAIVAGPGCLLYSAILDLNLRPQFRNLSLLHAWMMERVSTALTTLGVTATWQGTCDVTVNNKKVSGNSVRLSRHAALYHGTVLCQMPLSHISQYLRTAPRQPSYRAARSHDKFIENTGCDPANLANELANGFGAATRATTWPAEKMKALAEVRYRQADWTFRH